MADPLRPSMNKLYDRDLASPIEAEQVVREAIENSPEVERVKLERWWEEVKGDVTKRWEQNQKNSGFSFVSDRRPFTLDKSFDPSSILKFLANKDKPDQKS